MTFDKFFTLCCSKAGVQPTSRQRKNFLKGTGGAYMYAVRSGNATRPLKLAKREGLVV
jgi:hypothetical protein